MSSRRFFTTFAAMVLVEALTIAFSGSIAFATTSTCPAPGSTVRGGLVVTGNCTTTGVTISGGVTIMGGGRLTIYASTVNGGVNVQANGEFDANFPPHSGGANTIHGGITMTNPLDLDLSGGTVDGAFVVNGNTPRSGFFFIYSICGATLNGDLRIENLPAAPNGIGAGDPGETDLTPCAPNTIHGSVFLVNNPKSRIELEANTISGSVFVDNSQASLSGNSIGGSLKCVNGGKLVTYDSDDTNTNTIGGKNGC
jgi:hypothetical protein